MTGKNTKHKGKKSRGTLVLLWGQDLWVTLKKELMCLDFCVCVHFTLSLEVVACCMFDKKSRLRMIILVFRGFFVINQINHTGGLIYIQNNPSRINVVCVVYVSKIL